MQVGHRARVAQLERPTDEDRSGYVEREGLLVRRLNVPWTPDLGALWEVRFEDGATVVFSENELVEIDAAGADLPSEMEALREGWGQAPRTMSIPFRKLGGGVRAAPALLAFVVLSVAGALLIWAGASEASAMLAAAGGILVLVAIVAAAVLVA